MIWMPDSKQWVRLLADKRSLNVIVARFNTPGVISQTPIEPKGINISYEGIDAHLLGFIQTGRILAIAEDLNYIQSKDSERKLNCFEFSVEGGPVRLREYTISLPIGGKEHDGATLSLGEEVVLSPQGDRLAWFLYVMDEGPTLFKRLGKWIPFLRKAPRPRIELRTSKLDGSDMQVVGYMETNKQLVELQEANRDPRGLSWLPDGQHLSFIYDGALWTIPAGK